MTEGSAPRQIEVVDLDRVTAIEKAVFPDPWSRQAFVETLARPTARGFAVDDGAGRLIGYGVCAMAADEGEILNLAVDPGLRRRGAGRRLLAAMLDWLAAEGVRQVFLEVRSSNGAAIALYERSGFRHLGIRKGYYVGPREDALTMVLEMGRRQALE